MNVIEQGGGVVVGHEPVQSVTLRLAVHDVEDLLQFLLILLAYLSRLVLAAGDKSLADVREAFRFGLIDVTSNVDQAIHELVFFLRLHQHRSLIPSIHHFCARCADKQV